MLNYFPSALVQRQMSSVLTMKACWRNTEKSIPKRVCARTQPCFTPLLTGKVSEVSLLKQTVLCRSPWKDTTMWSSLRGQAVFCRRLNSPLMQNQTEGWSGPQKQCTMVSVALSISPTAEQWDDHICWWTWDHPVTLGRHIMQGSRSVQIIYHETKEGDDSCNCCYCWCCFWQISFGVRMLCYTVHAICFLRKLICSH